MKTLKIYTQSQRDCTKVQLDGAAQRNLIPIDPKGSLMHCKTRYYKFGGSPQSIPIGDKTRKITEAVVTGSFNPECSATKNNEYLLVLSTDETTGVGGSGGLYGGGAGSCHAGNDTGNGADGGNGAVRIIWGQGRSFPSNAD